MGSIEILAIIGAAIPAYVMGWVHTLQIIKIGEENGRDQDLSGLYLAAIFGIFPIPLAFKIALGGNKKKAKALASAEAERDARNTQALAYILMYASMETIDGRPVLQLGGQRVNITSNNDRLADISVGGLTFTVTKGNPHLVSLREMIVMGLATISKQ